MYFLFCFLVALVKFVAILLYVATIVWRNKETRQKTKHYTRVDNFAEY